MGIFAMKYNFETLYEHIGYLFYGLVSRDREISASDLLKLTEYVEVTWKPGASGDSLSGVYPPDYILRGIRYASANRMPEQHALDSFKTYFIMHALGFGGTLREQILASVLTIGRGFQGNPESRNIGEDLQRLFAVPSVSM